MSIANKLTYLEETKGLIKEKLNDLGAEITDDTFREYVEKLEEIYRNYPKTTFRGSDITLPIAKKEKIEIFPIGNTTQSEGASPDNPQPIKNVTGNNVVKITLANGEIIEKELNLGNIELCKIGDYSDLIFKNEPNNPNYDNTLVENGWYKKKVINKQTITSSIHMYYFKHNSTTGAVRAFFTTDGVKPTSYYHNPNLIKSNRFIPSTNDTQTKDGYVQILDYSGTYGCYFYLNEQRLNFEEGDTDTQKLTKYKNWFDNNYTEFWYPLKEQYCTKEPITEPTLINQLNELYSMMTTGETITIKTESEKENAQLNLEIITLQV